MKKINLVVGVAVAALLAGCKEEVAKQPEVRPVKVVAVSKEAIRSERVAIGDVRPALQSDLGFRVTGKLLVRSGKVGERVKKGDGDRPPRCPGLRQQAAGGGSRTDVG